MTLRLILGLYNYNIELGLCNYHMIIALYQGQGKSTVLVYY